MSDNWLTDSNGMSTYLGLFYTKILRNHIHCNCISTFFVCLILKSFFFAMALSNMNNLLTDLFDPLMGPKQVLTLQGKLDWE